MLPNQLEITGHPASPAAFQIEKVKEQNGVSTYKRIFPSGDELQIDVRHTDEKKSGNVQYERHNFDVKYTIFNADTLRGNDVYHFYIVIRRKKGTIAQNSEENVTSILPQVAWLVPRLLAGEY